LSAALQKRNASIQASDMARRKADEQIAEMESNKKMLQEKLEKLKNDQAPFDRLCAKVANL